MVHARRILDDVKPAVEKTGANAAGVIHSASGEAKAGNAKIDEVFRLAREEGIPTIGIGDWGNEIGMGSVRDTVMDFQPHGRTCLCPCGQGIADATVTDSLVVGAISNWGAYGIAAMLAILAGDAEVSHDPDVERQMLLDCIQAGAADGSTRLTHGVDSTSTSAQTYLIGLLREIVVNALHGVPQLHQTKLWEKEFLQEEGLLIDRPGVPPCRMGTPEV